MDSTGRYTNLFFAFALIFTFLMQGKCRSSEKDDGQDLMLLLGVIAYSNRCVYSTMYSAAEPQPAGSENAFNSGDKICGTDNNHLYLKSPDTAQYRIDVVVNSSESRSSYFRVDKLINRQSVPGKHASIIRKFRAFAGSCMKHVCFDRQALFRKHNLV